jgi:hypothetical protein
MKRLVWKQSRAKVWLPPSLVIDWPATPQHTRQTKNNLKPKPKRKAFWCCWFQCAAAFVLCLHFKVFVHHITDASLFSNLSICFSNRPLEFYTHKHTRLNIDRKSPERKVKLFIPYRVQWRRLKSYWGFSFPPMKKFSFSWLHPVTLKTKN